MVWMVRGSPGNARRLTLLSGTDNRGGSDSGCRYPTSGRIRRSRWSGRSPALMSSSSALGDLDVGIGIDLVALHDVFGGDFLAAFCVDLAYLMRWSVLRLIWLKETFRYPTSRVQRRLGKDERKAQKAPSSWRGAMGILRKRNRRPDEGYHRGTRFETWRDVDLATAVNRGLRLSSTRGCRAH